MHLAQRAYILVVLAAVLAISGLWSDEAALASLWCIPAGLLLAGLALEGWWLTRHLALTVRWQLAARLFLGRATPARLQFVNPSRRALAVEYAPALPPGVEATAEVRRVTAAARGDTADELELLPVRLGLQVLPDMPARVQGPLRLAWWGRTLRTGQRVTVAPDTLRSRLRPRGLAGGARARRVAGAGAELHQLRSYQQGDPLARIDWKATARTGALVTREFSEDQHLDILVAVDAGRLSRVRSGRLDRLGVYANLAARLGEVVTHHDDRIGLVVYADRVLASCAPARGLAGVTRVRQALEHLNVRPAESDPTAAAISMRALLKQRGLIVLLTDLDDANIADQLGRALRILSPPHLVMVAGVRSFEIAQLAQAEARGWQDPWIALAAQEHETRAAQQRLLLQRLGAPVVVAPAAQLEQALFARYEALRRSRRV